MLPLILENADFRPPTHVSSGCQWLVASSVGQRPKSPIPVPRFPILAGNRGGNPRFPTPPESGIGDSPIPDWAENREIGNPRFPIRPGPGIGVPMAAGRGFPGLPGTGTGKFGGEVPLCV
jgi:hypothetical protein